MKAVAKVACALIVVDAVAARLRWRWLVRAMLWICSIIVRAACCDASMCGLRLGSLLDMAGSGVGGRRGPARGLGGCDADYCLELHVPLPPMAAAPMPSDGPVKLAT